MVCVCTSGRAMLHKPVPVLFLHCISSPQIGIARFTSVPIVSEDWSKGEKLLMAWVSGRGDGIQRHA